MILCFFFSRLLYWLILETIFFIFNQYKCSLPTIFLQVNFKVICKKFITIAFFLSKSQNLEKNIVFFFFNFKMKTNFCFNICDSRYDSNQLKGRNINDCH